jgi:hypothetical protein
VRNGCETESPDFGRENELCCIPANVEHFCLNKNLFIQGGFFSFFRGKFKGLRSISVDSGFMKVETEGCFPLQKQKNGL